MHLNVQMSPRENQNISQCFKDDFPFSFSIQLRDERLKIAFEQSSISLPPQVFSSAHDSRVVTMIYLTLNDVLALRKEKEDEGSQTRSASTTVVSSTVYPKPPGILSIPVRIVLHNREVCDLTFFLLSITYLRYLYRLKSNQVTHFHTQAYRCQIFTSCL